MTSLDVRLRDIQQRVEAFGRGPDCFAHASEYVAVLRTLRELVIDAESARAMTAQHVVREHQALSDQRHRVAFSAACSVLDRAVSLEEAALEAALPVLRRAAIARLSQWICAHRRLSALEVIARTPVRAVLLDGSDDPRLLTLALELFSDPLLRTFLPDAPIRVDRLGMAELLADRRR